jgi:glycosyltransferase involved in cell wall biosynthesis
VLDDVTAKRSNVLSIVIPAHNEERRIGPMLGALRAEFPSEEIIVVANACSDGTARVVADMVAADPNLRLLDLTARLGKGGSVRLGFQVATGDVLAFVDADGATPPEELRRLVAELGDADCVVASRWSDGAKVLVPQTPLRRFLGRAFNFIVRSLFGLQFADTQCGAKIFRRAAIEEIIEDVETADFAFDVDVLFQLQSRGRKIREVPTVWRDREGSTVNIIVAAPRMLASILRLRLFHSPARYLIPFFDRFFGIRAIKCRRLLRILVISTASASALDPESVEGRFHRLLSSYGNDRRTVEWWTPAGRRSVALEYFRRHRSRFDCLVEISPNGSRFWTPFYSLKPIVMFSPHRRRLHWPYAEAELLTHVPDDAQALEDAIRRAMTRRDAYFLQEGDGSWTYHPQWTMLRQREAHVIAATASAAPAPASIQ